MAAIADGDNLEAVFGLLDAVHVRLQAAAATYAEPAAYHVGRAEELLYFVWLRLGGEHRGHTPACPACPRLVFDFERELAEYEAGVEAEEGRG